MSADRFAATLKWTQVISHNSIVSVAAHEASAAVCCVRIWNLQLSTFGVLLRPLLELPAGPLRPQRGTLCPL